MFSSFQISRKSQSLLLAAGSVSALGISGCSTTMAPPDEQLYQAEQQVQQAESVGASQYAQQSFNQAKSKLEQAQAAYQDEAFLKAKRLAEKAAADAKLAHVTTTNRQLKSAIEKLSQEIQSLEKELERKSS